VKNCFYALSKRGGGLADMGCVANADWLYHFEAACPVWTEALDILYDDASMREAWAHDADLWVVLAGAPPADEPAAKQAVLTQVFVSIAPLAVVRTATFLHSGADALCDGAGKTHTKS
jgi:hypothetical protein